ncbi:MAG: exodeoxyribonuclease III [Aestuariivirga sp.]|uniref:exodeoxyribonuclease III n=1 Tax=Aestuariivirga sp. TaxID=2650926 RepID=UPI0038D21DB9
MPLKVVSWNINSVRLRIGLVTRLLDLWKPDVLCLQETKCPQGQFPSAPIRAMGYDHIAEFGQKGYHGVAIVSKRPFLTEAARSFCGKDDCRHISVTLAASKPITIHNLYVPAGGDEPDPRVNDKFAHKLQFVDELGDWFTRDCVPKGHESILVGDLNIAPLEHDVWSHRDLLKVVSHTPAETEGLLRIQKQGKWVDLMRSHVPADRKLYTWWSYRARDWEASDRGRRLDHIWSTAGLAPKCRKIEILKEARGWQQPSDHVPVMASFAA